MADWVKCVPVHSQDDAVWVNLDQVAHLQACNLGTSLTFAGKDDSVVVKGSPSDILGNRIYGRDS